jgi:erythronate-4-phosphate dehydrogenase
MSAPLNHVRMGRQRDTDRVKIVVDQNIRGAGDTFGRHGRLSVVDGRNIQTADLEDADALIIRTTTRVDAELLRDSQVGFIGTTSIGTDHLDTPWLDQQGISWANAPGCNADSAAQYTLAMMWLACTRLGRELSSQRVGIIGLGNVGSRLQHLLAVLGIETVANDPPLAEQGATGLISLNEALNQDIVSLHVPLERDGPHATYRMIADEQLGVMNDDSLLVNAARGDVVDGEALLGELTSKRLHAALDVWPGEPRIDSRLLDATTVATPHVAGYSDDGKRNGTHTVYRAFCRWARLSPFQPGAAPGPVPLLELQPGEDPLEKALEATCFVRRHDAWMRELIPLPREARAIEFDRLRRDYPPRRDFQAWRVCCTDPAQASLLNKMGFP